MKIGALGSGDVAKVLGGGFLKHGHDVMMGTREQAKLADWAAQNPKGRVGGFAEAAEFAELVVLEVKGAVAADALRAAGESNLTGKTVAINWVTLSSCSLENIPCPPISRSPFSFRP
jgi:predicted dinucleotide-binding enzyme